MAVSLKTTATSVGVRQAEDLRVGEALSNLFRAVAIGRQRDCRAQGFTMAQARLLGIVAASGAVNPSELARQLGLSRQAMSSASLSLEREGLIGRTHRPNDRRQVLLSLTPKGRTRYRALEARQHRVHRRLEELVPPGERSRLAQEFMLLAQGLATSNSIRWYRCSRCAAGLRRIGGPR